MKIHQQKKVWLTLIVLVGVAVYFGVDWTPTHPEVGGWAKARTLNGGPATASGRSHVMAKSQDPVRGFSNAYKTPIEFYGKVVDQHGDAVAGAAIKILPFDRAFGESDTEMDLTSDASGSFSIKGLKGLAIGVQVTKTGYLTFPDLGFEKPTSSRRVEYGLDGSGGKCFKDPNKPTIFTLHNIGATEPIFYMKETSWGLPVDGTVRAIALDSKKGNGTHRIQFRFQSDWSQLPMDNDINYKRFDWSFEARVPGGGFLKYDSDYDFEAPEAGYQESIRFSYLASMPAELWKSWKPGRYFVKFADGSFARIRFRLDARSSLSMTSWLNLKPGSRNLASPEKDTYGMPNE